eukprot:TRINITY_DN7540_c0_g1_i1.p1 TRINITY_DN7540_c0_g1~~TRINITY_DN7540_c0_g1_i1.p1  ORF type:complete len:173 (-),score=16.98 TRINITY_DN7540_c0_g1_i1:441-959(-)
MSFGQTQFASKYDRLHHLHGRPMTVQKDINHRKKQAELKGSLESEPGTIEFDRPRSPGLSSSGSPGATRKLISTERKQEDITGRYQSYNSDVKQMEDDLHATQMNSKLPDIKGAATVFVEAHSVPGRSPPVGPRVVGKGFGDRSSHIECLPLGTSNLWADNGYNVLPVAPGL